MPRPKRAVQPAEHQGDKPVAPDDLWERLAEVERRCITVRPPNTFTFIEYIEKRGLQNTHGERCKLERLVRLGELEKIKKPGSSMVYYRVKEPK